MEDNSEQYESQVEKVDMKKEKGVSKATAQKLLAKYKSLQTDYESLKKIQEETNTQLNSVRDELEKRDREDQQKNLSVRESNMDYQELQSHIDDLTKLLDASKREREKMLAEMKEQEEMISKLKDNSNESASQIASLQSENTKIRSSLSKSQVDRTNESRHQDHLSERVAQLEGEINESKRRSAEVFEEGKALAKKQLEIETKDRALKAKLRERNEELSSVKKQLSEVSYKLEKTTETVIHLQSQLQDTTSSHAINNKKTEELQRDFDNLQQLHGEREKLYSSVRQEADGLAESLAHVSAESDSAKEELTRLQALQEASVAHVRQLEELVSQSTDAFNAMQKEMNAHERELELGVERLEEQNRQLSSKVAQQEQTVSDKTVDVVRELEKERRKKVELTQRIGDLQSEVKILRAANSSIAVTRSQVESEEETRLTEAERRIATMEEENSSLHLQVVTLQQELSQTKRDLSTKTSESESAERQLRNEVQNLHIQLEKSYEEKKHCAMSQSNEVQLAQSQFDIVNKKYEETVRLVSVMRRQLQEKESTYENKAEVTSQPQPASESISAFASPIATISQPDSTTRVFELEQALKAKEGRMNSMDVIVQKLKRDAEQSTEELLELKMKNDELEKKIRQLKEMEEEMYALKIKYNEMVEEYSSMREDLIDLRDEKNLYKQQLKDALSFQRLNDNQST